MLSALAGMAAALEDASRHPALEAALQGLGTPLTLPLLRHLVQRQFHGLCKMLVNVQKVALPI